MLQKLTREFASHGMPIHCDIYTEDDYPTDTPVFLYFHSGGLVGWSRTVIPPWVVQMCWKRKWPLISPSYRLMPQTGSKGLMEDVFAAYEFARSWQAPDGAKRRVIAGGSSGGFFPCTLLAHHHPQKPLALLSIQGINSFRHEFFNSSTMLTPEPIPDSVMAPIIAGPTVIGETPDGSPSVFSVDKLRADGSRNVDFKPPLVPAASNDSDNSADLRGMLYDYYIYKNQWVELLGNIDPGYAWAKEDSQESRARVAKWPPTVVFHGNQDYDVVLGVSEEMRDCLGPEKVTLLIADGQEHLYELRKFIEDDEPGMDTVRQAVACLDGIVKDSF
ncbi:hypothetical protein QQS21_002192 [Conoideocrella luteorostrata]|uniref:Alpha/beta hydrolase fold-3 domain-containing protein n=1 Tax=Conoideocrella luteorostrata TaxID=1105319 RepID=A0AAJ0FXI7_9HYPO|nr:hypothetical protein QQS21_002192 [Conoideocrella luteorostrata]